MIEKKLKKKARAFAAILLLALLALSGCKCAKQDESSEAAGNFDAKAGPSRFAVAFTTNVQGYVEPCGCTSDPLGGVGRLAALLDEADRSFAHKVWLVDAGNLLFDSSSMRGEADRCQDEGRINLLLSVFSDLKLVGTVPGPMDEKRGFPFRDDYFSKYKITSLAAEVEGKLVERGDLKVGFLGVRLDSEEAMVSTQKSLTSGARSLKENGAAAIVLVSQCPVMLTKTLMRGVVGVDVVIQGREPAEKPFLPEALAPDGPWLVSAGMQGQYLGVLEFDRADQKVVDRWTIDDRESRRQERVRLLTHRSVALSMQLKEAAGSARESFVRERLEEVKGELAQIDKPDLNQKRLDKPHFTLRAIALRREVKPLSSVQAKLDAYERSVPELVAKCEGNVVCPKPKQGEATFVGAETCRACHQAAYDVWQKAVFTMDGKDKEGSPIKRRVGHSKAWKTLEEMHKTSDRACVSCHSIGFDQPGGYCKTNEVDFRKNVQCESCHGAGSLHAASADKRLIRREVPEGKCRECHHVPHIPTTESFVYSDKVRLILGEGHGSSLLKKLNHQAGK